MFGSCLTCSPLLQASLLYLVEMMTYTFACCQDVNPLTMKAELLKATEKCFFDQFICLYQASDIQHTFPAFR